MRRGRELLLLLGLCAGLCGCSSGGEENAGAEDTPGTDSTPAVNWPEGTVLAVDDLPLAADEVDPLTEAIAELYPAYVQTQNRRLALTNEILERYAVRSRDREERERALERCLTARSAIEGGQEPEAVETSAGGFRELGDLAFWDAVRRQPVGSWSEPIELIGRWVLLRVDERLPSTGVADEWHEVSYLHFPYLDLSYREGLDPYSSVQEAVDGARLTVVDPAWSEVVPAEWKHRMGALDQ